MKIRDWLIDLSENYRWDIIDGEVAILPIKEDEINDCDQEIESFSNHFFIQKIWSSMAKAWLLLRKSVL